LAIRKYESEKKEKVLASFYILTTCCNLGYNLAIFVFGDSKTQKILEAFAGKIHHLIEISPKKTPA
jgi:hypothetical protein